MTTSTYECSKALYLLSKSVEPKSLGRILGAGTESIIIKPYDEYLMDDLKLKRPVLIITQEKEKYTFLKKMLTKNVKKLNIKKFDKDTGYFLNFLKGEGWDLFYVEQMEEHNIKISSQNLIEKAFYELSKDTWHLENNKNNFYYYLDNLKEYLKKYEVKEKGLYLSIKKAFTALKNTNINSNFKIDLHMGQFLKYEGKLVCVDPVWFNFREN